MPTLITATNMIRSFSDIVGRVYYQGESFDIQKGNNIVARLSPINNKKTIALSELNNFFTNSPHLEPDDLKDFSEALDMVRAKTDKIGSQWE